MKKKALIPLVAVLVLIAIGLTAYATKGSSPFTNQGQLYRDALAADSSGAAATYKGQEIPMSAVEYQKKLNVIQGAQTQSAESSDRDIVNRIIGGKILLEEAEARGITVTQEDVDAMVSAVEQAYAMPEGKEMMDEYFEGAGITAEEYFSIIREQMPETITHQRVRDAIGMEYCEAHGIEFTKENPPPEIREYVDAYIAALIEARQDDIVYYVE